MLDALLVILLVAAAAWYVIRRFCTGKDAGGCGCSGGCGGCGRSADNGRGTGCAAGNRDAFLSRR